MPTGLKQLLIETHNLTDQQADKEIALFERDMSDLENDCDIKTVIMARDGLSETQAQRKVDALKLEVAELIRSSPDCETDPELLPVETCLAVEELLEKRLGLPDWYVDELLVI